MALVTRILLLFMVNIILGDPLILQIKQEVQQNNCPCNGCCDPVQTTPPTTPTSPMTTPSPTTIKTTTKTPTTTSPTTIKTTTTTPTTTPFPTTIKATTTKTTTTPSPTTIKTTITTPTEGCIFGGITYPNGTQLPYACARVVCSNGNWSSDGMIDIDCRVCKVYLDPHILTFAKQCYIVEYVYDYAYYYGDYEYYIYEYEVCVAGSESYAYQGVGNHSLSQSGNSSDPTWAVYSTFESCGRPVWDDVSCVDTVTFKNDEHTIITIGHATNGNKIQVNGADYNVSGTTPSIVEIDGKVYPVMAWESSDSCLDLLGSSGIMVRYCSDGDLGSNSVYLWAATSMGYQQLEGLCGNFTFDGFTARDGETWPWSYTPPEGFGQSWMDSQTRTVKDGRSNIKQTQNRCESNSSALADIQSLCYTTVVAGFPNGGEGEVLALIHDCVYDLCNVSDPVAWMKVVEQTVQQQADIKENTINLTSSVELSTVIPSTTYMPYSPIPITVGNDSFMLINQLVTWIEARALCGDYGLDMYKPIDILTVAEYLNLNFSTYYWLGARGNGTHMVWNTGGVLNEDDPWSDIVEYFEVDTDYCLDFYTTGNSSEVGPLVASGCHTQSYVLCGLKNTQAKFKPNKNTQQKKKPKGDQKKTKTEMLKGIKEMPQKSEE